VTEVVSGPARTAAGPLGVLSRIRRAPRAPQVRAGERCEVCAEVIGDQHGHLVDLDSRALRCACRGCYLLFAAEGSGGNRFRAVPERYVSFPGLDLSASRWDALQIPVSVAFFFVNSALQRVAAFYPSPAGATESLLPLATWSELVEANPVLATLRPDVEAFLVRSERGADAPECFLVPIDACYELVGRLRTSWRGFDGGSEALEGLATFFDEVRTRARPLDAGAS
jgi:hypothetical protein